MRAVLAAALELSPHEQPKLCLMEPPPINERFAPAEGYTTHEALKAIFRHYADLGRKPRDGVERGVDRTQWAKLVSETPDLPARLATADADLVFAKVAARGARRLGYNRFLEALAQTSLRLYPTLDPCEAFAALCAEHIFGLVAVESDARGTVRRVLDDLERPAPAPVPGPPPGPPPGAPPPPPPPPPE